MSLQSSRCHYLFIKGLIEVVCPGWGQGRQRRDRSRRSVCPRWRTSASGAECLCAKLPGSVNRYQICTMCFALVDVLRCWCSDVIPNPNIADEYVLLQSALVSSLLNAYVCGNLSASLFVLAVVIICMNDRDNVIDIWHHAQQWMDAK